MLALTLLQASAACLLTGLLLCGVLRLAARRWPSLAAQRSVWLGAQLVLAAAFVLPLLPDSHQLSMVPELAVPAALATPLPLPLPAAAAQPGAAAGTDWLALLPAAWCLVYLLGVLYSAWRWQRGHAMLRALVQLAQPRRLHGQDVLEVDAPVSPMLVGAWRPRLLLPAHLSQWTPLQQQLVIAHELTHARRGDPLLLLSATVLKGLLWFNPAAHWLAGKLAWAQELGCDRQVLAGRPQAERQQYAGALLKQLNLQLGAQGQPLPGLAFGSGQSGMCDRLLRLRSDAAISLSLRVLPVLLLCAVGAASLALQPALALSTTAVAASAAAPVQAPLPVWRNPLERMRVTGFFGVVRPITPKGLSGLDLAAARGTHVHAVADGIATVSEDARLGKAVRIDHGGGWQSVYAHLDTIGVASGDAVAGAQVIGAVGATGRATGPHLHFQVWHKGKLQDPQSLLAGLDANASARALRMRREQFGR